MVIKVKKAVPTICSLDLEFNQFQVNCEDGKIGLEVKEELLCGELTGQTVTLAFDEDELLEIRLSGMMSNSEDYNVTVRQIDCPDSNSATQELTGTAASAPVYTQFQDFTARIVSINAPVATASLKDTIHFWSKVGKQKFGPGPDLHMYRRQRPSPHGACTWRGADGALASSSWHLPRLRESSSKARSS